MATIADVLSTLHDDDPPVQYSELGCLEFEIVNWNGRARIVPSEALALPGRRGRPFMYRGQTTRYPTCMPSLLRGLPKDEWQTKARLTLERFRVAELELILRDHPFSFVAAKRGYWVDYHGLAQHYGIPTSLLDLSSNAEVAAFFAVSQWQPGPGTWAPMESGSGVMFRFDWSAFGPGYSKFFEPVGFGPGLRPARQHAWTFRMRPGIDFQNIPNVTAFEFQHSRDMSAAIMSKFENGATLYPPDCLASLVEKVRDLPFVTMHAIRHSARQDGVSPEGIEDAADRAARFLNATIGIDVVDGYELQPEETDLAIATQQSPALEDAISRMPASFRLVRVRKQQ